MTGRIEKSPINFNQRGSIVKLDSSILCESLYLTKMQVVCYMNNQIDDQVNLFD